MFRAPSEADLVSPILQKGLRKVDPDLAREMLADHVWKWCGLSSLPMWLRELEVSQKAKQGSYSTRPAYDPAMAVALNPFFAPRESGWYQPSAARHANRMLRQLGLRKGVAKLELASLDVASASFIGRTGLGWPVCSSNPKFKSECLGLSRDLLDHLGDMELAEKFPAILGSRGQPTGLYQCARSRPIWGCSRVIGNLEKMVQIPTFARLNGPQCFAAWQGQRSVDYAVTRLLEFASPANPVLSVDFKAFDASVPRVVINACFDQLTEWFAPSAHQLIRFLQRHFNEVGIMTPEGLRSGRTGGIPSGAVLTNLIGSLANMWVMHYASSALDISVKECQVQGDDGVYVFKQGVNTQHLSLILHEHFGMTLSVDKSLSAGREVHFLQNVHRSSYRDRFGVCAGVRPIMRVLNGMMSYEKFRMGWTPEMNTLRWMQQMEAASAHPCFEAFVDWFSTADEMAKIPLEDLIRRSGGIEAVVSVLGGGAYQNRVQVEDLGKSRVVHMLRKL